MEFTEVMAELERLGTEQNRKVYRRHGSGDAVFGVSFANLNTLQKRVRSDQALAEQLWASGNADARTLAAMIAEPSRFTREKLEGWLAGVRYPLLIDLLVKHVASKTPFSRELMERWTASDDEWIGRAGWVLLAALSADDPSLPDALFEERLAAIEASIHRAKNRARDAMNSALIGIGARNEGLRDKALTAARRIGKVEVDHGETGCKTADAVGHIEKMWIRRPPAAVKGATGGRARKAPAVKAEKPTAKPARTAAPRR